LTVQASPELSLANLSVADAGPIELIDAAAAAAFDSVNMWLVPPPAMAQFRVKPRAPVAVLGNAPLIREIKLRVAGTGVRVAWASCGWIGPNFAAAEIPRVLDTMAEIGAQRIAVVGWDADRERLVANLAAVCTAAARYTIAVTLEFMPYSAVRTVGDAAEVVRAVAAPNLDVMIDALHLTRSGGVAADLAAIDPERIVSVQLCDAPLAAPPADRLRDESVNRRLYPGDGELPLGDLMDAIPRNAVVEVEVPSAADAERSIEARARLCADRTRAFLATYRERAN
jgi:sugar phosphate isomerase/epimerase